ncbi:MAG: D-alanyl-D-alanine carboxypeptidase/D-alanyl-D-alanine-endopeptidase [Candidatus Delongbacteria bacterium]|nr:D-alanyl-D-alanine carboxypeptidase/D-alanyl-D-alanine-endopeptidase [Candidatus Delongbacteria bacterium]
MKLQLIILGLGVWLWLSCTHVSQVQSTGEFASLQSQIDQLLDDTYSDNAHWGVYITSLKTGKVWYSRNYNKLFMPASNTKLVTTTAAYRLLGPDFTYRTPLYYQGSIQDGCLKGNLIVVGQGDPSISPSFYSTIDQVFDQWCQAIKKSGIQRIDGNLVGQIHLFSDEILGQGWAWDYQSDYYAAQIAALCYNDNVIDIKIKYNPSKSQPWDITMSPDSSYLQVIRTNLKVVPKGMAGGINAIRSIATNQISLEGSIDSSSEWKTSVTIDNPNLFYLRALRACLQKNGIVFSGDLKLENDSTAFKNLNPAPVLITEYQSPTLSEITRVILKVSHNLMAEQVFRTLGLRFRGYGSTRNAVDVIKNEYFSSIGIDPERIQLYDGSGLARYNLIAPRDFVTMLETMARSKAFESYYPCLPIAGTDGTISGRMKTGPAAKNVHAKTGFISNARALSGYVTTRQGEMLAFSMILNNYTAPTQYANNVQDKICTMLADYNH